MSIYFRNGENKEIEDNSKVKIIHFESNNSYEVKCTKRRQNNLSRYKRKSKNEWIDTATGEIIRSKEYGSKNTNNMRRALKKLEYVIRNNFTGANNELHMVLTTEEEIHSYDVIQKRVDTFLKQLKQQYNGIEYIYVLELQEERNSWHAHVLLKDMLHKRLYINYNEINALWRGNGTKIKKVYDIDGLAHYLAKEKTKTSTPKFKKLYYKSRGIKTVEVEQKTYKEFKEDIKETHNMTVAKTLNIKSTDSDYTINSIKTEIWTNIHSKK